MHNKIKVGAWAGMAILMALVGAMGLLLPAAGHAEYNSITQTDVGVLKTSALTSPSNSYTFPTFMLKQPDKPTTGLSRTITQSAYFQAAGTSPVYTVEVLCSMDGITFTKPDIGGDLGSYTGTGAHFMPVNTPLSPGGHRLRFNETGGANSVTWTVQEAAQ